VWRGHRSVKSRPQINVFVDGRKVRRESARVAFLLEHGRWPTNECCHHCDNPSCVRPSHLFDGTHRENMSDAHAKGLASPPPHPSGMLHHSAKLTDHDVRSIRASCDAGRVLARRFGVSDVMISRIRRRLAWTHI
jgi:hypothetical protein